MHRLLLILLLLFAIPVMGSDLLQNRPSSTLGAISSSDDFLPVHEAFRLNLTDTTPETIKLRFVPTEGYYLYRHKFLFKTEPANITLGTPQLPPGEQKYDKYFGDIEIYRGILDVNIPRPANGQHPFTLVVTYQGCANKGLCYPPRTERLSIGGTPVETAIARTAAQASKNVDWRELALFFIAGLSLTFTPCVLPMLPIVSGVVLRGQVGGFRGFKLSLAYVLPMATCFALLGALMGIFGAQLNLQARLQSAWVLVPFALFFAIFALAMFGVFELKLPQVINNRLDRITTRIQGGSLWGAALLGIASSLLVSPCVSAPLAGALLYISASGDALGGALKLFALGLGMGIPLLVVATGGSAWLPKSGSWLVSVKNAIGVLLLGLTISLLSRVLSGPTILLLIGLLAAGVSLFCGTLEFGYKTPRQRLAQLFGLFLLVYALACWYGTLSGQSDPFKPVSCSKPVAPSGSAPQPEHRWQTVSTAGELEKLLTRARATSQPLLLDWYADWCISCKVIESKVLNNPQVLDRLKDYQLVRFDMTASNTEQRLLLDRYQLFGPPALMFFRKNGSEISDQRVIGGISVADFAERVVNANDQI